MRILEFNVDNQHLEKIGDFSNIIRGTKNYLRCKFNFKEPSNNTQKHIAVFNRSHDEYAVLLDKDNTCLVPNELADHQNFKVRLVTICSDYQIRTNQITVRQE